jgi:nitroreductase
MDIIDALKKRKSIRNYLPEPVSKEVLQEIITVAMQAPSAMNTQPWELFVVGGETLDKIRKGNVEALTSGTPPKSESTASEQFKEVYKRRQVDLAIQLFQLMKIERDDSQGRFEWMQRGFRFFDAPAAIILAYDQLLEPASLSYFDFGCLTQSICLTALNYDLGTCIHGQGVMYPQVIRKHVDIPESKKILMAISIGKPDWDFAANQIESQRVAMEDLTTWAGF